MTVDDLIQHELDKNMKNLDISTKTPSYELKQASIQFELPSLMQSKSFSREMTPDSIDSSNGNDLLDPKIDLESLTTSEIQEVEEDGVQTSSLEISTVKPLNNQNLSLNILLVQEQKQIELLQTKLVNGEITPEYLEEYKKFYFEKLDNLIKQAKQNANKENLLKLDENDDKSSSTATPMPILEEGLSDSELNESSTKKQSYLKSNSSDFVYENHKINAKNDHKSSSTTSSCSSSSSISPQLLKNQIKEEKRLSNDKGR